MRTNPVRGCNDILPKEMELRQQVCDIILNTYKNNGFLCVKTPILESLENLVSGDSGDNSKIMFKTIKRGAKLNLQKENLTETDICEEGLRYDLTVPLARLYCNNESNLPLPFKSIQIEDSFRAERPQVGRDRQFTQCDIDIFGTESILGEIEIISTTMETYSKIGLPKVVCKISSRKILDSILRFCKFEEDQLKDVCIIIDKIDKIGIEGCEKELSTRGFNQTCINNLVKAINQIKINGLQETLNFCANKEDVKQLEEIISVVKSQLADDQQIIFDISVVRGQGYYTGAVFEMYCPESGFNGAIGGGGRYDKMYQKFTGKNLCAVGFGLGLVSVLLCLQKLNIEKLEENKKLALIYNTEDEYETIMQIKNKLKQNYDVSLFPNPKNFKEFKRKLVINGYKFYTKINSTEINLF